MTNSIDSTDPCGNSMAVLITNYNKAAYIADAVRSALAQDLPVYVIDDCSDDGSYEYLQDITGIHLLRTEKNSGPCIATLTAAQQISETYTILLDGDDVLCPNAAHYYQHLITDQHADVIYTRTGHDRARDMRGEAVEADIDDSFTHIKDPVSRYLKKQFVGTAVCLKTFLLKQALSPPGFFIQDLLLAFNTARLSDVLILSEAKTHYLSQHDHSKLTHNGRVQCKDIARLYLYALQFDEIRRNKHFARYSRRIYGSLPAFSHQYPWLRPKWKKRVLRWYRRYLMPRVDYDKIRQDMQYFLDNADRYFDA